MASCTGVCTPGKVGPHRLELAALSRVNFSPSYSCFRNVPIVTKPEMALLTFPKCLLILAGRVFSCFNPVSSHCERKLRAQLARLPASKTAWGGQRLWLKFEGMEGRC